jgi:hypothetical protein
MRRLPDHAMTARRYANCADENIPRADTAINEKERTYHALIAAEYLLLAEKELQATYRRIATRRSVARRRRSRRPNAA